MTHFDFMGNSKKFFTLSAVLIVAVIIFSVVRGPVLDVQFKGGSIITYSYEGDVDIDRFGEKTDSLLGEHVSIRESMNIATQTKTLIVTLPGTRSLSSEQMESFTRELQAAFPQNNFQSLEINNVDATIGREFLLKSIVAMLLASILIILYVGFRFRRIGGISAGAMGVLALIHDVLIAYGVFVAFGIPIDDNFIAVILTILGFSINDTIVIYDRIRENKRILGSRSPIGELVNTSINQSFYRSVNTSVAAVMAMIVVAAVAYFYNVESIQSFALPMIFGLISGAYSSICIAGPLWVKWQEHKQRRKLA